MHSRVFAVAIIVGLLAGCASSEGNSDEIADLPVESSPLRCPSSGASRCAYLAPGLPIESRVVGERRENSPPIGDEDMHERVPQLAEVPHATFEGMWDDDPDGDGHTAALCGYLIIEEPYVHVLQTERDWGQEADPGLARSEDGSLLYAMIMLPRPGTRYDAETRSLWVYGEGPMTDGDHVLVGGGEGYRQPDWPGPNMHQRLLWQANGMKPADYPC